MTGYARQSPVHNSVPLNNQQRGQCPLQREKLSSASADRTGFLGISFPFPIIGCLKWDSPDFKLFIPPRIQLWDCGPLRQAYDHSYCRINQVSVTEAPNQTTLHYQQGIDENDSRRKQVQLHACSTGYEPGSWISRSIRGRRSQHPLTHYM